MNEERPDDSERHFHEVGSQLLCRKCGKREVGENSIYVRVDNLYHLTTVCDSCHEGALSDYINKRADKAWPSDYTKSGGNLYYQGVLVESEK